jgi:hypothetical protein
VGLPDRGKSAAGTSGAGTGAATAAAYRIGGGDGKSGPIPRINKIHFDGTAGIEQSLIHQEGQFAFLKNFVVVL